VHIPLFEQLQREQLISNASLDRVKRSESSRLFSIHWELKTLLYLGVLLLTTGLGVLVYKNIDTIGHTVILALIAIVCIGCFFYCQKKKLPFSTGKVSAPNAYFDYILLLGCLMMITFITYLQVQYTAFGNSYGLATFIPMVVLFFCAYYFDHLGILSLAITNLAAWMGIAVTPMKIFKANNFEDGEMIFAGLILGAVLVQMSHLSSEKKIKKNFSFTYLNFGINILFVATLAGMFYFEDFYILWLIPLIIFAIYFYRKAIKLSSFYLMLMLSLYSYAGISYAVIRVLDLLDALTIYFLYFIGSAVYLVIFLMGQNKKLKKNDSL
jgi:hypothetical protein